MGIADLNTAEIAVTWYGYRCLPDVSEACSLPVIIHNGSRHTLYIFVIGSPKRSKLLSFLINDLKEGIPPSEQSWFEVTRFQFSNLYRKWVN